MSQIIENYRKSASCIQHILSDFFLFSYPIVNKIFWLIARLKFQKYEWLNNMKLFVQKFFTRINHSNKFYINNGQLSTEKNLVKCMDSFGSYGQYINCIYFIYHLYVLFIKNVLIYKLSRITVILYHFYCEKLKCKISIKTFTENLLDQFRP